MVVNEGKLDNGHKWRLWPPLLTAGGDPMKEVIIKKVAGNNLGWKVLQGEAQNKDIDLIVTPFPAGMLAAHFAEKYGREGYTIVRMKFLKEGEEDGKDHS